MDALYLLVSSTLAVFDILPPKGGKLEAKFVSGLIV